MSVENIVALVATLITSIPAFIALYRDKRTRIFFFKNRSKKVNDSKLSRIANLDQRMRSWPLRNNMYHNKGTFVCLGKSDIKKEDIIHGIRLLPNNGTIEWFHPSIIEYAEETGATIIDHNKYLEITFPLLRDQEAFSVQFYANAPIDNIRFRHRIANVGRIIVATPKVHLKYLSFAIIGCFIFVGSLFLINKKRVFGVNKNEIQPTYFTPWHTVIQDISMSIDTNIVETETGYNMIITQREEGPKSWDTVESRIVKEYSSLKILLYDSTEMFQFNTPYDTFFVQYSLKDKNSKLLDIFISVLCTSVSSLIIILSINRLANYYKATRIAGRAIKS